MKETSYIDRRFCYSYILFIIIIGGILVLFIYITRLASNEIFSPSNKIQREVGRAKDLSAPLYNMFGLQILCAGGFLMVLPRIPFFFCVNLWQRHAAVLLRLMWAWCTVLSLFVFTADVCSCKVILLYVCVLLLGEKWVFWLLFFRALL
jgi:hypothetical protein